MSRQNRIVLSGEHGSRQTTALHWLARHTQDRLAIVLDAKAYADLVPHLSPFEWVAEQVYPEEQGEERRLFGVWLAEQDKANCVVWLVDDLFVIPPDERKWVARGLQRVKGNLVVTAPAHLSADLISEMTKGDDSAFELVPLDEKDVEAYIERYHQFYGDAFDDLLCRRVCREVPDLATSPLGLALMCNQVRLQESDCASVIARYINEPLSAFGATSPTVAGLGPNAFARSSDAVVRCLGCGAIPSLAPSQLAAARVYSQQCDRRGNPLLQRIPLAHPPWTAQGLAIYQ